MYDGFTIAEPIATCERHPHRMRARPPVLITDTGTYCNDRRHSQARTRGIRPGGAGGEDERGRLTGDTAMAPPARPRRRRGPLRSVKEDARCPAGRLSVK